MAQQPGLAEDEPLMAEAVWNLPRGQTVAYVVFEGQIDPFSEHRFYRKIEEAKAMSADVVVIEINSPGGLVSSSVNLANYLNDLDWATTVAYIPQEAISGAAMMSLGCDQIVMHKFGKIGDIGPIVEGQDSMFRHAPEKIVSHLVQVMRDLAEAHDRPAAIAASMVDKKLPVYRVTNKDSGEIKYLSEPEWAELDQPQDWDKGAPLRESVEGRFLELNGERAVSFGLANGLVKDCAELAKELGIQPQDFVVLESNWIDSAAMLFNSNMGTFLLVVLGMIALYVELMAPGLSVGGLVAGLCCALFFWSRFLGGTSGWLEVVLFAAGIVFVAVEIFVLPGFGIGGFTGGCLLLASVLMASQRFAADDGIMIDDLLKTILVVIGSSSVALVAMVWLSQHFGKLPVFNRLTLAPPAAVGESSVATPTMSFPIAGSDESIELGDEGVADSTLRPAGRARFKDQFVDVTTDGSFIEPGEHVRVIRISGAIIMVQRVV